MRNDDDMLSQSAAVGKAAESSEEGPEGEEVRRDEGKEMKGRSMGWHDERRERRERGKHQTATSSQQDRPQLETQDISFRYIRQEKRGGKLEAGKRSFPAHISDVISGIA